MTSFLLTLHFNDFIAINYFIKTKKTIGLKKNLLAQRHKRRQIKLLNV